MVANKVKVSVITVCYNAAEVIAHTINSVLKQNCVDFEYIVVDGASSDSTYDLVQSYQPSFEQKNVRFIHVSERDGGIYQAMNKAIQLCNSSWVIFMNAGDYFGSDTVLTEVFSTAIPESTSVIYGKVVKFLGDYQEVDEPNSLDMIRKSMPFCHQAAFVLLDDIRAVGFDTQFRIAADYDMFLGLYLEGKKFIALDLVIAYFSLDGVSSKNMIRLYDDFLSVQHKRNLTNKHGVVARLKRQFFVIMLNIKSIFGSTGI